MSRLARRSIGSISLDPTHTGRIPVERKDLEVEIAYTEQRIADRKEIEDAFRAKLIAAGGTPTDIQSRQMWALTIRLTQLRLALATLDTDTDTDGADAAHAAAENIGAA